MTIVCNDPDIIFVHVPKTGGTSVSRWLLKNAPGCKSKTFKTFYSKHTPYYLFNDEHKKYFSFGIVRNPWERMVSGYFYELKKFRLRMNKLQNNHPKVKPSKVHWQYNYIKAKLDLLEKGFDAYVQAKDFSSCEKTQKYYLEGVDCVLRLENLQEDFVPIQNKVNCYQPLVHLNKTDHDNYKKYYTSKIIKKVIDEYFAEDIDIYQYVF